MGEVPERSPWGPWAEFGRGLCASEEAVAATIDQILTDGGTLLWQKYLERKAFSFASNAISEALVSRLRMCYVHHDAGESAEDGDLGPAWQIEEEPQPCEIDSWARMHLPVRRSGKTDEASTSGTKISGKPRRGQLASSSRPKAASGLSSVKEKPTDQPPRVYVLENEYAVDPEEERMREAKALEEARKRDKERMAKESAQTQEEERRKVQQLHEEMSKRPHTFDTEGNLIWVDELKPERLPKLVEAFGYSVKREPRLRDDKAALGATSNVAPKAKQRSRRHRGGRSSKRGEASPEFTDGFSKLQHGQPPILETMVVVPGVTLEQLGKVKSGPDDDKQNLSRREYVQLAEQEVALDSSFRARGGSTSQDGSASPPAPPTVPPGANPPGGEAPPAGGGGGVLPQIMQGRGNAVAYPGGPPGPDGERTMAANPSQKAPPAPPAQLRMRKYEALGFGRDPRYHPPNLGGGQGLGSAQPVLGATMGHGLMKNVNKEAFFFPPAAPELPLGMLRSQSDAVLGSARRGNTPGRGDPSTGDPASEGEDGGRLRPEQSAAYRSFRHALVPGESANSTALIR